MIREYWGLRELKNSGGGGTYCPKCGNTLQVVANGWFHGELFYCPSEDRIFGVELKDVTNLAGDDFIQQCRDDEELREVRNSIKKENVKTVKQILLEMI